MAKFRLRDVIVVRRQDITVMVTDFSVLDTLLGLGVMMVQYIPTNQKYI